MGGNFLESFFAGLGVLKDGWLFIRFLFWMTLNWGIAIISYYLIIRAFFPQAQLVWGMFGLGGAAFGGAIPALPGAVGTFEGAFGGAVALAGRCRQSIHGAGGRIDRSSLQLSQQRRDRRHWI